MGEDRPLACFAGIWTPWACVRKKMKGWEECEVFAFLTTEEERDAWLRADWSEATVLQRPLADGTLEIVKRGLKHDIG